MIRVFARPEAWLVMAIAMMTLGTFIKWRAMQVCQMSPINPSSLRFVIVLFASLTAFPLVIGLGTILLSDYSDVVKMLAIAALTMAQQGLNVFELYLILTMWKEVVVLDKEKPPL